MHFMIGRIFMNQENKVINVHLEKRESKDYLVFGFEEIAEVQITLKRNASSATAERLFHF